MATFKSEFQELAAELIDDEFADFRRTLTFSTVGSFDPVTEVITPGPSYSYQAIPGAIDMDEWQGTDVQVTDTPVAYTRIDSFMPSVSSQGVLDSKPMQVIAAKYDAADATVKLVLRGL
jgi:hypothetical protein